MRQGTLDDPAMCAGLRFPTAVFFLFYCCFLWTTVLAASSTQDQAQRPTSTATQSPPDASAEAELRTGTELTRRGLFPEAIPHFLVAEGHVADEHALRFNLALCYLGTAQFAKAIHALGQLKAESYDNENVENLLAQAYIGSGQTKEAYQALERAAGFAPKSEKLYAYVADACADRQDFDLGLQVVDLGLQHLPKSARLHYQRGYFLVMLNHWDPAQPEFDQAASLAPQTDIGYLAEAQKFNFAGDPESAIRVTRQAVREGRANSLTLAILGDALISAGATPGQPEFAEAEAALQKAVEERPQFAGAHISLGSAFLMENRLDAAIQHLEIAKTLSPSDVNIYSRLAVAYRRAGNKAAADAALASLAELNAQLEEKIRTAPGDRRAIMSGGDHSPNRQQ